MKEEDKDVGLSKKKRIWDEVRRLRKERKMKKEAEDVGRTMRMDEDESAQKIKRERRGRSGKR